MPEIRPCSDPQLMASFARLVACLTSEEVRALSVAVCRYLEAHHRGASIPGRRDRPLPALTDQRWECQ